jgi:mannose-6-phosphate isomerase
VKPLPLPPNQLHRFYRGGEALARFRGMPELADDGPEDWVGSTTTAFGDGDAGLARFADGTTVRDAIRADPEAFLGPGRTEPGLLVKLLDAGERLPVHCHPDRSFAAQWLGSPYGKTEAWLIVETSGDRPLVWLGFRDGVAADDLTAWVTNQDVAAIRGAVNELEVSAGDVLYVPAGLPHALGEGILMVELQEPTDFSVLLEWQGFAVDGAADGHLGVGWPTALEAVDRSAWPADRLATLRRSTPDGERVELLPGEAADFFRGERLRPAPELELEPALSLLVVVGGSGRVECAGGRVDVSCGETLLVPHGAGPCALTGHVDVIRCLPAPS